MLGLGWRDPQEFPPELVATVTRVAELCAAVLERTGSQQRERHALARAERAAARLGSLYALTTRLAGAVRAGQVADTVMSVCMSALGASAASVCAYDGVQRPRELATYGLTAPATELDAAQVAKLALVTEMVATRRPVLVTSRADRDRRYPEMSGWPVQQQAWANLPLLVDGRLVGLLTFGWDHPRVFATEDVDFLTNLAAHTAIALDRARLLDASLSTAETLRALQDVTAGLATAATSQDVAAVLADRGVALVADRGVVAFLDTDTGCWRTRATPGFPADIARRYACVEPADAARTPLTHAAAMGRTIWLASREEVRRRYPEVADSLSRTGSHSQLVVPVLAGGRSVGAIAFGFGTADEPDATVLTVTATLADLAGQALQRAQQYEADHHAAHLLQQALLPEIADDLPGVQAGVCYRPAQAGRDVGGDWYDVFELPGNRVGFVVGDVVGHDLRAATVMGQLQTLLRSVAIGGAGPAEVLDALDTTSARIEGADCATVGYAEYSPTDRMLRYACAGHPPPLLLAGRQASYLVGGRSQPLGVPGGPRAQAQARVPADAVLLWYSDGLIERRDADVDHGLDRLAELAARLPAPGEQAWRGAQAWADALLVAAVADQPTRDDVVLACLHLRAGAPAEGGTILRATVRRIRELTDVRASVREWAARQHISDQRLPDLLQVCTEALANALEHAAPGSPAGVELTVALVGPNRVHVQVTDHGRWRATGGDDAERGRGLAIINELADRAVLDLRRDGTRLTAVLTTDDR